MTLKMNEKTGSYWIHFKRNKMFVDTEIYEEVESERSLLSYSATCHNK